MSRTPWHWSAILLALSCALLASRRARAQDESDVAAVRTTDRLVFTSNRAGGKHQVYSMTADGGDVQRIGKCEMQQFDPALSPDGSQIAFAGISDEAPDTSALFVMNADGSDVKKLADTAKYTYVLGPRWSPDGKQFAFYTFSPDGGSSIHVVDRDGRGLKKLAEGSQPAWSPDGSKIVYEKLASERLPATTHVCSLDMKTGEYRTLTKAPLMMLTYSPDGKQIAYLADKGGQWDVYVADAQFTNERQLTRTANSETAPQWSADGRSLYFSRIDADTPPGADASVDIVALDIASGEERQLTDQGINALGPVSFMFVQFFGEPMPPP